MLPTVKIAGILVRNAGFSASTCLVSSPWFSCGVAVSMGEAGKHLLFECVQAGCHVVLRGRRGTLWHSNLFDNVSKKVKIGGSLVRNAGFSASTCLVSSFFSCGVAVSMGEVGKHLLFECVQAGCHVVLRGRHGTLWHSNLFDNVSKISKLEEVSHKMLVFWHPRVLHSSLLTWDFTLHTPHFTLHSTLSTPHSTLYTPHSTLYTLHSTLLTPHFTVHSTLHTLYFTLLTPHSTLYTPHSSLHTLLYTPHFILYTPHFTLHTLHSSLHTLHTSLYTPHSTLCTPHSTLYTPHSTLYTPHSTLHTLHFTLHTPHSALYTPHSTLYTLYTPHSTLYTPHSLLHTPHSTLYTFHSTLQTGNKGNMYKTVQINDCRKVLCVTA